MTERTEALTEAIATVLSERMDLGTSGRYVADYGVTIHSLASEIADILASRLAVRDGEVLGRAERAIRARFEACIHQDEIGDAQRAAYLDAGYAVRDLRPTPDASGDAVEGGGEE